MESSPNNIDFLQPEIIPKETLVELISRKCPHLGNLKSFDHNILVDLFYKNVAPLPQRKYRHNRRGREMTRNQIIQDKRKRKHDKISHSNGAQSNQDGSRLISSFSVQPSGDRLRPPPNPVNFDRKVIKLRQRKSAEINNPNSSVTSTRTTMKVTNNAKIKLNTDNTININSKKSSDQNGANKMETDSCDEQDKINGKESKTVIVPKPKIIKIMPQKSNTPASKIKLKRPSAVTFEELAAEVSTVSESLSENIEGNVASEMNEKIPADTSHDKITDRDVSDSPSKSKMADSAEDESLTDEGAISKKFNRVSVTWP